MILNAIQAPKHFEKNSLAGITLIYGDETLLNQEALDSARNRAKTDGYDERRRIDTHQSSAEWTQLLNEVESPSLFSPRSLIELHTTGKKLDKTAVSVLKKIATFNLHNIRLILHLPNIEKPDGKPWFKALEKSDFLAIRSYQLKLQEFEKEIQRRLLVKKLQLSTEALQRFLDYHAGNLAAAQQSINRLAHYPEHNNKLDIADIENRLDDFSHHSVFAFRDALLQRNWLQCYRIAQHIEESDKKQIIMLNYFLARDINLLLQLKSTHKEQHSDIFKQAKIFHWQQKSFQQALPKFSAKLLTSLLHLSAKIDRVSKGDEHGDPWLSLRQYCLLRIPN